MRQKEKWTAKYVEHLQNLAKGCLSLNSMIKSDEGEEIELGLTIPSDEPSPEDVVMEREQIEAIEKVMKDILDPKEIVVMQLRFGLNGYEAHTLREIGEIYGITRERVRQIEVSCIRKLRRHFGVNE